jgi:hypothetical protein
MKLILTGATGFVGTEVLTQTLANPSITSIIALSRKPLPSTLASDPKLKVVLLEDFTSYPPTIMSQLAGADACIWYVAISLSIFLEQRGQFGGGGEGGRLTIHKTGH